MHGCHANAECMDTDGSFTCSCREGFTGDGINCTGQQIIQILVSYHVIKSTPSSLLMTAYISCTIQISVKPYSR